MKERQRRATGMVAEGRRGFRYGYRGKHSSVRQATHIEGTIVHVSGERDEKCLADGVEGFARQDCACAGNTRFPDSYTISWSARLVTKMLNKIRDLL